jgi:predicted dehydrogenase/threonine dehydrogenase-like Zn-dependent dehydrogenase
MKAILQNVKTGRISVDEIPQPVLKPGSVLVRNVCSLVSAGTEKSVLEFSKANYLQKARQRPDLFRKVLNRARNEGLWQTYQIVRHLIDQPITLGYSCAGIAREVGSEVEDIRVDQRVACAGLFYATHSEIVAVPRNLLVPIPDSVSFEEASFVTLGAIAMQAVRLSELSLSENVVVYGLGLVGMVVAQLALSAGSRVIGVDLDSRKVELVRQFGCEAMTTDAEMERSILDCTGGYGADKVILCAATSSNEPIERIPALMRQKGMLVVVGDVSMNVPRRKYYEKEIDIRISRSYGPGRYDLSYEEGGTDYPYGYVRWTENRNMSSILDLAARRRVNLSSLVTHRFNIDEAQKAYDLIEGKIQEPYLGIVIRYCDDSSMQAVVSPSVRYRATQSNTGIVAGVIGAGSFAKAFLLPAFSAQGVKFRTICSASGVSAASVAKKYGASLATANPKDILENGKIELVLIATRHDSHAQYVDQALVAGKAVYVEKPLVLTLADLERIKLRYQTLMRENKRAFLMVGYNRRFSPLATSLKQVLLRTHEPITAAYRVNAGPAPVEWVNDPVLGGGRIVGECCHFVDFLCFLVGHLPVSISASSMRAQGRAAADTVTMTLAFADGSLGSIHYLTNGHSSMPKEYVEVTSGGIGAQLSNFRSLVVYGAKASGRKRYFNQVKGFMEEAKAVVESMRRGLPAPISFEELYATSRATLLVRESLTSGRTLPV